MVNCLVMVMVMVGPVRIGVTDTTDFRSKLLDGPHARAEDTSE